MEYIADILAYREVCSGRTGHAEAVQLTYQTGSVGYGELVEFFYRTHDPTTVDRQGPDRGSRESLPLPQVQLDVH
jgi:peptide-methionine (S)-S-oxide reductase